MPGMPFYVEKGPQFSVIESYVLDDRERGIDLLEDLRAGGTSSLSVIAESIGLTTQSLDAGANTAEERVKHLNAHWFEQHYDKAAKRWVRDPQPSTPAVSASGHWNWWHGYAGDVYEIMRQTMITAAEVSLGIEPGQDPRTAGRKDPWPIELFWHCGQNWFEGWVTWRRNGPGGQVTVLLCTPTAGTPIRPSPLASAAPPHEKGRAQAPPYSDKPKPSGRSRGMVVVTHHHHERVQGPAQHPVQAMGTRGVLTVPVSYWQGCGPVVRVMPSEPDGGVLPGGRTYDA